MNARRWVHLGSLALALGLGCASGPQSRALPRGVTFEGRWYSNFKEMKLRQQGKKVWGTVEYREGSLSGELDGDMLRFSWSQHENHEHGRGYLQISGDGTRLEGRWGYGSSTDDGGRWWAERSEDGSKSQVADENTGPIAGERR